MVSSTSSSFACRLSSAAAATFAGVFACGFVFTRRASTRVCAFSSTFALSSDRALCRVPPWAQLCPYYGTPQGCRRGRKRSMVHVTADGSLAVRKALPQGPIRHRARFRTRLRERLTQFMVGEGAVASVHGMAFTRDEGPLTARCLVSGGPAPSRSSVARCLGRVFSEREASGGHGF